VGLVASPFLAFWTALTSRSSWCTVGTSSGLNSHTSSGSMGTQTYAFFRASKADNGGKVWCA